MSNTFLNRLTNTISTEKLEQICLEHLSTPYSTGIYIGLEGGNGCGKTTQKEFLGKYFKEKKLNVIYTFEPGGDDIANDIRKVVQVNEYNISMSSLTNVLLYASSRSQTTNTLIEEQLKKKGVCISDRTYVSSIAFQHYGQGVPLNIVLMINAIAVGEVVPDIIINLDIDPRVGITRCSKDERDKWEEEDLNFHDKIRQGYLDISKKLSNMYNVDASGSIEQVKSQIIRLIESNESLMKKINNYTLGL